MAPYSLIKVMALQSGKMMPIFSDFSSTKMVTCWTEWTISAVYQRVPLRISKAKELYSVMARKKV